MTDLPLLRAWTSPLGAPPFESFRADELVASVDAAIDAHRAEIAAITDDPAPATFANTIEALERAGAALGRVKRLYGIMSGCRSDDALRAIEPAVSTKLAAHGTAIGQDAALFARVAAVWEMRDILELDEERFRLLRSTWRGFLAGGATLDSEPRRRFAEIEVRLAALSVRFGQNVLAANAETLALDKHELGGLPDDVLAPARDRAVGARQTGAMFTLGRGDVEDVLTYATRRDVRERAWRAFAGRCDGGPHDNTSIVAEMVALRAEKARLLGYPSFAAWRLEDEMAGTPEAASTLMERVWPTARAKATREATVLQARISGFALEPWDWRFYTQAERASSGLDADAVRVHLTVGRVVAMAFAVAGRLFGIDFDVRDDLAGWHPDVRTYVVRDGGAAIGLLYLDPVARTGKHGGAWMTSLRAQERMDGRVTPIIAVCCNFASADARLSIDEARTFFHEFGHALHGLLSDVTYPSLAGTSVPRDFVELPSKLMENWIVAPAVLAELGMPPELIEAIGRSGGFGEGLATAEFLLSGLVDMAVHASRDPVPDVAAIEAATIARLDPPPGVTMRHRLPHFTHLFDGGYAGAYYSYLWSEVLDADAWASFEAAGVFDQRLAHRYRVDLLARGDARDPMDSYRAFVGHDPDIACLLRHRGLEKV